MARDLLYGFSKIGFSRFEIGEIQTDFNMSLVIDGTKDSTQILVASFDGDELEPYTIVYHAKSDTWWIVAHDKVERYLHDKDYYYIHNIELTGAIELTNARDLTDCGFNQGNYTIGQFVSRLIHLSNFEFQSPTINYNGLNSSLVVNYVKSFENYSLLSALREFFDGYNCSVKLSFTTTTSGSHTIINNAVFEIIQKTGNPNGSLTGIDWFDDVKEIKTIDKNSFGATVISNAENVISTEDKTFPQTGSIKLSSTQFKMTPPNAILRLPSKVFKGNWLKMFYRVLCYVKVSYSGQTWTEQLHYFPNNPASIDKLIQDAHDWIVDYNSQWDFIAEAFINDVVNHKAELQKNLNDVGTITLYDGSNVDPTYNNGSGRIIKGKNVPYLAKLRGSGSDKQMVFCDKDFKDNLPDKHEGIAWQRGSNIISGFEFLSEWSSVQVNIEDGTDWLSDETEMYSVTITNSGGSGTVSITVASTQNVKATSGIPSKYLSFAVNYIPMSDIKIKVDNAVDKIDSQLYNQTGKLTDSSALSKLLNSYSKQISSDIITRYKTLYDLTNVPKCGDLVYKGNTLYVINNVSMNFYQSEGDTDNSFDYCIECEFTMSKNFAVKSLMVNPDTNIRDYGIPQNFNVKRKQLYRDYYELSYSAYSDANENTPYLDPENIFVFDKSEHKIDFVCVIKIDYAQEVHGATTYYYQLETTNYVLDKMIYVVLDFNDNNIIGYGSQNAFGGFDISRVFSSSGWLDNINTPISYVDADGKLEGLDILFLNNYQITSIYDYYILQHGYQGEDDALNVYNYSVFIPQDIYDVAIQYSAYKIRFTESSYKKDPIEVPVFEYACQVEDSDDVIIGDNIFTNHKYRTYFYTFVLGDNLSKNNVADTQQMQVQISPVRITFNNGSKIEYEESGGQRILKISLYQSVTYYRSSETMQNNTAISIPTDKDIAIFRHATGGETTLNKKDDVDLMFICKKGMSVINEGGVQKIRIVLNHYKLK